MRKRRPQADPDSLLTQTKRWLRRSGLRVRKSLGQHFLVDEAVLDTILEVAALTPDDTVIEVGPGNGVLTKTLAERAGRVIGVELDDRLAAALQQSLKDRPNVTIVNADILQTTPGELVENLTGYKVVADLPYYITSPVLRHFLEAAVKPSLLVVMVQKEVAAAISAGPGQRSVLSIAVQYYGQPEIVATVPAAAFYPPPEVDSAVLKIAVYDRPPVDVEETGFFRLVRAGFAAARKQAANALAQGLDVAREETLALLEKAGIDPKRRAETFTLEEWAALWRAWAGKGGESKAPSP